jgi:hypothetical protein
LRVSLAIWKSRPAAFRVAPAVLQLYRKRFMGQQHRVRTKRKRRLAYLERKKTAARAPRRETAKTKVKKASPASAS